MLQEALQTQETEIHRKIGCRIVSLNESLLSSSPRSLSALKDDLEGCPSRSKEASTIRK